MISVASSFPLLVITPEKLRELVISSRSTLIDNKVGFSGEESKPSNVTPTLEIAEFGIEDFSINGEFSCPDIEFKIVVPVTLSIGSSDILL